MEVDLGDCIAQVNHNSDWSGDVYINRVLKPGLVDGGGIMPFEHTPSDKKAIGAYVIPGEILLAVGKAANKHSIIGQVIAAIEDIE